MSSRSQHKQPRKHSPTPLLAEQLTGADRAGLSQLDADQAAFLKDNELFPTGWQTQVARKGSDGWEPLPYPSSLPQLAKGAPVLSRADREREARQRDEESSLEAAIASQLDDLLG